MGTTSDKLNYLNQTKTAIKDAIIAKGVNVPDNTTFRDYATKIEAIQTGSNRWYYDNSLSNNTFTYKTDYLYGFSGSVQNYKLNKYDENLTLISSKNPASSSGYLTNYTEYGHVYNDRNSINGMASFYNDNGSLIMNSGAYGVVHNNYIYVIYMGFLNYDISVRVYNKSGSLLNTVEVYSSGSNSITNKINSNNDIIIMIFRHGASNGQSYFYGFKSNSTNKFTSKTLNKFGGYADSIDVFNVVSSCLL